MIMVILETYNQMIYLHERYLRIKHPFREVK